MASRYTLPSSMLLIASLASTGLALAAEPPSAADRETARTLMATGDGKLDDGDLTGALEAYRGADAIMGVPTTALAVGRVYARMGKLIQAVDALSRARRHPVGSDEPEAFRNARVEAAKLDAELARRIPTIQLEVTGPQAETPVTVSIDGSALTGAAALQPRRVDPGQRVVVVEAPGFRSETREIDLVEQQHEVIQVALEVDPNAKVAPPDPSGSTERAVDEDAGLPLTVATWVGFGVGGAGLILGGVTGAIVLSRTSDLEGRCGGTSCPASEQEAHDTTQTLANVSNAGFVLGAVGVAVGTTALILDLTGDDEASDRAFTPILSPGFVGLHGRF